MIELHEQFTMSEGRSVGRERESKSVGADGVGGSTDKDRYVILPCGPKDRAEEMLRRGRATVTQVQGEQLKEIYRVRMAGEV